jgi:Kef-type K+ transport system membrane component KefB
MLSLLVAIGVGGALSLFIPKRFPVPRVVLMVLAGMSLAPVLRNGSGLHLAVEVALFVVLFEVGAILGIEETLPIGRMAIFVATVGAAAIFLSGFLFLELLTTQRALIVTLSAIPTSGAIASEAIAQHGGKASRLMSRVIPATVADDFIGLAILAAVPLMVGTGAVNVSSLVASVGILVLLPFARTRFRLLILPVVLIAMLLGASAALAGVSCGYVLAKETEKAVATKLWFPLKTGPGIFFVGLGAELGVHSFGNGELYLIAVLLLTALAISRIAIWVVARDTRVALAMMPRGEVTAAMVLQLSPLIGAAASGALVLLILLSTTITFVGLRLLDTRL